MFHFCIENSIGIGYRADFFWKGLRFIVTRTTVATTIAVCHYYCLLYLVPLLLIDVLGRARSHSGLDFDCI